MVSTKLGAHDKIAHLSLAATNNIERRFKDLYKLIKNKEVLKQAYAKIKSNTGSKTAGIDKVTRQHLKDPARLEKLINELHEQLSDGSYTPLPVRRVDIPKGYGKTGTRPLGIPALKDRIIQQAVKFALEPLYEPLFKDSSHGYRPKRSCQTAVSQIVPRKYDWVVEGDIKGCFDNIKHGKLLDLLRIRIADEKFINLINKFLKSGYQMGFGENGKSPVFETLQGTPQGGIVSPVLANIYLHEFDKYMETKLVNLSPKDIKPDRKVTYFKNHIYKMQQALEKGQTTYKLSLKITTMDSAKTYHTEVELAAAMQEVKAARAKFKIKTNPKEYRVLNSVVHKMQTAIKKGIYPYQIRFEMDGSSTRGNEHITLKNTFEIRSKISEFRRELKKISNYDKEDYFNNHKSIGYVRYADDFVIMLGNFSKQQAIEIKEEIAEWFDKELKLTLSLEKTKVTHATKGFTFLGYDILKRPKEQEGKTLGFQTFSKVYIPAAKIKKVKDKLENVINAHHNAPFGDVIRACNAVISGWANYFKICNNLSKTAGMLDNWLWHKLMANRAKKHKSSKAKMAAKYSRRIFAYGKTVKRLVDTVEGKLIPIRRFADYQYVAPKEMADSIRGLEEQSWWHSDFDQDNVQRMIAQVKNGYSYVARVELEEKNGQTCSKCGEIKSVMEVHHTKKVARNKRTNSKAIIEASKVIPKTLLCYDCHTKETTKQQKQSKKKK